MCWEDEMTCMTKKSASLLDITLIKYAAFHTAFPSTTLLAWFQHDVVFDISNGGVILATKHFSSLLHESTVLIVCHMYLVFKTVPMVGGVI